MKHLRILVAVRPLVLSQVIGHLLRHIPSVEIVSYLKEEDRLARHARRLLPNVIIVNDRFLGEDTRASIADLKNASPGCKLIFTSVTDDLSSPRSLPEADAQLNEVSLTRRLIPTVNRLVRSQSGSASERRSAESD